MNGVDQLPSAERLRRGISALVVAFAVLAVAAAGDEWRPATYHGLTVGKSNRLDVERTFGRPDWSGHPEDEFDNPVPGSLSYEYDNVGGFHGKTVVWMTGASEVITDILLYVREDDPLSKQRMLDQLGTEVRYIERPASLGPCPTPAQLDGFRRGQAPSYPTFVVIPEKGLYFSVTEDGHVREIVYTIRCPADNLGLEPSVRDSSFDTPGAGQWSSSAAYLWPGPTALADRPPEGRHLRVESPDGKMAVLVDDSSLTVVTADDPMGPSAPAEPIASLAEVLWSPDSTAFAVTWSDGGWVGSWSVQVYRLRGGVLETTDVSSQATAEFNRDRVSSRTNCEVEAPNVGAAAWVEGSRKLVLVLEAPPHSSCCDMGRLGGYLVDVPTGQVHAGYGPEDLEKLWGKELGARFR